jgi:hypothetical protein
MVDGRRKRGTTAWMMSSLRTTSRPRHARSRRPKPPPPPPPPPVLQRQLVRRLLAQRVLRECFAPILGTAELEAKGMGPIRLRVLADKQRAECSFARCSRKRDPSVAKINGVRADRT